MRKAQAVVELVEGEDGTFLIVQCDSRVASLNLDCVGGPLTNAVLRDWAQLRLDKACQLPTYLVPPTGDLVGDVPPMTNEEIDRCFKALTNGCGEMPVAEEDVFELPDGDLDSFGYTVYVGNGQPLANVPAIVDPEGYDAEITWAICNAGRAIWQLREEQTVLRSKVREIADQVREWLSKEADALYALTEVGA